MTATKWPEVALGDVATLQRGFDLPRQQRRPGPVPILAANGQVGFHNEEAVGGPGVVTGRSGSIGKVHYCKGPYWPLNTSLFVKDFHDNDPRWVYWLLRSLNLSRFHEGTGVPTLNRNVVHRVPVAVPPIEEQRRIAAVLDESDTLRAKRRESLALVDYLTESIFLDMFGELLASQDPVPLGQLIASDRPICYGILKPGPDLADGAPYVRVVDMKDGGIDASAVRRTSTEINHQYRRSLLRSGDLLMSIRGHVGRLALVPGELDGANITQDSARISIAAAHPRFVLAHLRAQPSQRWMARHTRGVAVRGINIGDVRRIPIAVPPGDAQAEFARRAEAVEHKGEALQRSAERLDELFASLQQRAFRGDL